MSCHYIDDWSTYQIVIHYIYCTGRPYMAFNCLGLWKTSGKSSDGEIDAEKGTGGQTYPGGCWNVYTDDHDEDEG